MKKEEPKYVSVATYNPSKKTRFEFVSEEKVTVEGEAMTIQELMARHANGIEPRIAKQPRFEDTEDFNMPDLSKLNTLDIYDRTELYNRIETAASKARKTAEKAIKTQEAKKEQEANERSVGTQSATSKADAKSGDQPPAPVTTR